jgi:hypothetical protein
LGHRSLGPSGVVAQSSSRIRFAISPEPEGQTGEERGLLCIELSEPFRPLIVNGAGEGSPRGDPWFESAPPRMAHKRRKTLRIFATAGPTRCARRFCSTIEQRAPRLSLPCVLCFLIIGDGRAHWPRGRRDACLWPLLGVSQGRFGAHNEYCFPHFCPVFSLVHFPL